MKVENHLNLTNYYIFTEIVLYKLTNNHSANKKTLFRFGANATKVC